MKIQQPTNPETGTKVDFLFERANRSKLVKFANFWDKGGTINPHITYTPLVNHVYLTSLTCQEDIEADTLFL